MMITVVALLCHMIAPLNEPVCREEIVVKTDMQMMECQIGWPKAVADWKEHSIFKGEQWTVAKVKCAPGDYIPRDAI